MNFLTVDKILLTHQLLVAGSGGSQGVRDRGLLESAVANAFATFGGVELHPDPVSKAAALSYGIINNHPFIDGNKRIGIHMMLVLLRYRQVHLSYTEDELVELGFGIASGEISREMIKHWIDEHSGK